MYSISEMENHIISKGMSIMPTHILIYNCENKLESIVELIIKDLAENSEVYFPYDYVFMYINVIKYFLVNRFMMS